MTSAEIYSGNNLSIDRVGGDWAIWRIVNDGGEREQLILTEEAMDELRDYFAEFYSDDRALPRF